MQAYTFESDVELVLYLKNVEGTVLGESVVQALPQSGQYDTTAGTQQESANYIVIMKLYEVGGQRVILNVGEPYELVAETFKNGDQSYVMARSNKFGQPPVIVPCQGRPTTTPQTTAAPASGPTYNCTNLNTTECILDLPYLLRTSSQYAFKEYIAITSIEDDDADRYCYSVDTNGQVMCRALEACLAQLGGDEASFAQKFGTQQTRFCEASG